MTPGSDDRQNGLTPYYCYEAYENAMQVLKQKHKLFVGYVHQMA